MKRVSNLLGLEYDPRMMARTDVLSSADPIMISRLSLGQLIIENDYYKQALNSLRGVTK